MCDSHAAGVLGHIRDEERKASLLEHCVARDLIWLERNRRYFHGIDKPVSHNICTLYTWVLGLVL